MGNDLLKFKGTILDLPDLVKYADDAVISKTILDKKEGTLTVFSFDKGQGLSEHVSPYDATVIILDGNAKIKIGDNELSVDAGKTVIMPAGIPHSLRAEERFKMLLIMIRESK